MAAPIFVMNEENGELRIRRGAAGVVDMPGNSLLADPIFRVRPFCGGRPDAFLCGQAPFRRSERQALHEVWRVNGQLFYDSAPLWTGREKRYPSRTCIGPGEAPSRAPQAWKLKPTHESRSPLRCSTAWGGGGIFRHDD